MTQTTIVCDQAIFTSIRSPMGEGYRIVAASRGVKPEEKQAITRCSPSHEALCAPRDERGSDDDAAGTAFYTLPSGRLCAAFTCNAGAEHTGRGGQRVYTHNVVFAEADFAKCGYNPLVVLRAMKASGLTVPQLTPNLVLPSVELAVDASRVRPLDKSLCALLPRSRRCYAARCLMDGKAVAVELPKGWTEWAEALVLGIPGPMRAKVAFSAGLRFSLGRGHSLQVFNDERHAAASRASAQGICFVDSETSEDTPESAWLAFVEGHWSKGDVHGLMRRTSRPFADCSPEARERIGKLYNATDALPQTESVQILSLITCILAELGQGVEREIQLELCNAARSTLLDRLSKARWENVRAMWSPLLNLWRRGGEATAFAQMLIACVLRSAMKNDPQAAAETALDVACDLPVGVDRVLHEGLLNEVLHRLAEAMTQLTEASHARLADMIRRWQTARPTCPLVAGLIERCAALQLGEART
ncbi:MAG: hypothetical protein Q7R41_16125 [Phycisphaerales bacterium]|nr:hypothetical protein [Phycisphaerales bacterium]